jgi:DNA-binding transcriptional regulator YiaG
MVFQLERTSGLTLILAVAFHSLVLPILEESPPIDIARLASLDELNPFRANLARNISVNDRIIEQSLWEQHKSEPNGKKKRGLTIVEYNLKNGGLKKRVDEKNPPIINLKSCLFCEGKAKSTATVDMGDRTFASPTRPLSFYTKFQRLINADNEQSLRREACNGSENICNIRSMRVL